ncbi:MAG: Ni/Fe hydrogenase subunit alpha [Anaerolineae bacterium]
MATLTFPLSRIEGHAQVSIDVENGQAVSARFEAMELRGFEYIVLGAPAEQMPVLVPRICGVCSTAHHVAAVKALEDIYGVAPPPLALRLRELLLLGQLIQNQATSLFLFTMPDRLQVDSLLLPHEAGNAAAQAAIAQRALRVRRAGTDLITVAGGQFIHPVKAVVGGVTSGIEPAAAEDTRRKLETALPVACALFDTYWEMSLALRERIGTWGDDTPTHYLTSVGDCRPDYTGSLLRVQDPSGALACTFSARDWRLHLTSHESEYSYAGHTSYRGEVLRANSLARINMARRMGTPRADEYLARFRAAFGRPAHGILLYDLCRGIEMVYALERALDLLAQPLVGETEVPYQPCDGEGYGLVEAPRGPLIHQYRIERGLVADAHFVIPTVHNGLAIERALLVAARRYVRAERVDLELERAVGRVVRAFDPCIACATH